MTSGTTKMPERTVLIGTGETTIEDVVAVARLQAGIRLNPDPRWQEKIHQGAAFLDRLWRSNRVIYGVNTGYGDSCGTTMRRHRS